MRVIDILWKLLACYAVLVGFMFVFQRALLYHPDNARPDPVASGVPEMARVRLSTNDGLTLDAWYGAAAEGSPSLIYFHGNGGHLGHRAVKYRPYLEAGFGLLAVGYRGFGGNPSSPTEGGLRMDARAALDYLRGQGVALHRIVLYGESLGTGVAVDLAAGRAIGALVLEAAYTSIAKVAAHHYPFVPARYLVLDKFDASADIKRLQAPLLLIHGKRDRVIPYRFGRALFEDAPQPKEMESYEEGGHNDLHEFGAASRIIRFIRRVAPPKGANLH
jgi:hypothetical protein